MTRLDVDPSSFARWIEAEPSWLAEWWGKNQLDPDALGVISDGQSALVSNHGLVGVFSWSGTYRVDDAGRLNVRVIHAGRHGVALYWAAARRSILMQLI